jgi:TrmH family RNA methyltransferase
MIASVHNPLVKHLVKLRESRKYRKEQLSVVISGCKLVKEIASDLKPKRVFVESLADSLPGTENIQVTGQVLKKITGLISPEPIAAEFPLPLPTDLTQTFPLLVLDSIRDPGNLGTLARTALALGWQGIFFLPSCTDPFSDKVLRASRGALFRLPWQEGTWEELAHLKKCAKLNAYIADVQGEALETCIPSMRTILLLSNEAKGIARPSDNFGTKITIPMKGAMESLNVAVAGAILMYHLNGTH